jgi:hypothetical protein
MNLTELQTEVYTQTNLPHLVNETLAAVRSATLKLHQLDYFYRDIKEAGISFSAPDLVQNFEYKELFPRWRALKYFRRALPDGTITEPLYEVISPENFMDAYNIVRTNVCYVAGNFIQIRSTVDLTYAIIGFYEHPDITVGGYNSWIAKDYPYAIVHEAAAQVFAAVGDTAQATSQKSLALEAYRAVQVSNIQAMGY